MAKYYGTVGFAKTVENPPGVWKEQIVARPYIGDANRINRRLQTADKVNDDITINNEISILADPYACRNFHAIRYVTWMGAKWKVTGVEVQYPRLILSIGGVYNGEQD